MQHTLERLREGLGKDATGRMTGEEDRPVQEVREVREVQEESGKRHQQADVEQLCWWLVCCHGSLAGSED